MEVASKPLSSLRVADIMHGEVVSVSAHAELAHATTLMMENEIGCLPVIDEHGRCVGVLTARDFVARFSERDGSRRPLAGVGITLTNNGPNGSLLLEETPQDYVSPRMSKAVQTIPDDAPVLLAARYMCAAHLHHLVILDCTSRPVGIISSTDILNAVVSEFDPARDRDNRAKLPAMRKAK